MDEETFFRNFLGTRDHLGTQDLYSNRRSNQVAGPVLKKPLAERCVQCTASANAHQSKEKTHEEPVQEPCMMLRV